MTTHLPCARSSILSCPFLHSASVSCWGSCRNLLTLSAFPSLFCCSSPSSPLSGMGSFILHFSVEPILSRTNSHSTLLSRTNSSLVQKPNSLAWHSSPESPGPCSPSGHTSSHSELNSPGEELSWRAGRRPDGQELTKQTCSLCSSPQVFSWW